ncbi:SEC-C domain-containing protein [Draconibacterium sediminis]|uniref:SEC-C domain-containing protein n=1 Tax=Draconibacterium sediminis TaxID=1544798 RepID=UPI0026F091E7|nr:SEC-C domain-containing protein [Draconibacterium sediminis]
MNFRDSKDIINDLKQLVNSKGYIYALCLIIMDDFHFNVEKMHEINNWTRLNKNEVSLLVGLMLKDNISLEKPNSPSELTDLKKKTYQLMDELHSSTMKPMANKYKPLIENPDNYKNTSKREFFGGEDIFIEPIFYGGDGVYDFQYLEFLERKYQYDREWLIENKQFDFNEVIEITFELRKIHQERLGKVNFLGLNEDRDKLKNELRKDKSIPKKDRNKNINEFLEMMEFFQYFELFEFDQHKETYFNPEEITEKGWNSFYDGLLNLFSIAQSDFDEKLNISSYLENFSNQSFKGGVNKHFNNIGDFNEFNAKPIIELSNGKYFIPITYSVFEAVYESPYYWMLEDKSYKNRQAENRGKAGENITYELLCEVFGKDKVFASVKIESKKGHDDTDIDVLCILGSKALCVQVKSKKLTQISRKGNFNQLLKDFKGAVQDAYDQGLVCRERILENTATFYNSVGDKIQLSEDIEEVYILGVTTENYPTLPHQTYSFLEKEVDAPYPLILTVFDLELVLFYLNNPYDFSYYVRQRIDLMEYFNANEEIHFLAYHLINKLWKDPKLSFIQIDQSLGQLIDRNYYPLKLGIETSAETDEIRNRWKNEDFEILCKQISEINSPKTTDIIFHLLDWSAPSRENLVNKIRSTKAQTLADNSWHNISIVAGPNVSSFGLTFVSWENNDPDEFMDILLKLSNGRKYKSKADHWIGIGCLRDSGRLVDGFVLNDSKWEYDEFMEGEIKWMFEGKNKGKHIKLGRKIGRNEPCPCCSGRKYKHCCGRNN